VSQSWIHPRPRRPRLQLWLLCVRWACSQFRQICQLRTSGTSHAACWLDAGDGDEPGAVGGVGRGCIDPSAVPRQARLDAVEESSAWATNAISTSQLQGVLRTARVVGLPPGDRSRLERYLESWTARLGVAAASIAVQQGPGSELTAVLLMRSVADRMATVAAVNAGGLVINGVAGRAVGAISDFRLKADIPLKEALSLLRAAGMDARPVWAERLLEHDGRPLVLLSWTSNVHAKLIVHKTRFDLFGPVLPRFDPF